MDLNNENGRGISADGIKKYDADKFNRFLDNFANDVNRYMGDAKNLEDGYGKYYNNSTYVGKAANASKEFIGSKQFDKFHVESKDIQKDLFDKCVSVQDMFKERVDPSPKARIDSETLERIKLDQKAFSHKLEYEGSDIECIAREIERDFGKYGDVTQPNYRRAMEVYGEFCGNGGFWEKCIRKFEDFNEEARQYMKRSMIKEHSEDLQRNIKATATALEGMTVFKTDVQGQSVWLNALGTKQAVVDSKKLAADIKECFELTGIKYDKNAIVDANIIKEATDLALLKCKSKNEKVALLACSNAMQGLLVEDFMTIEQFLKAFWDTLALIGTTLVTIVSMAASAAAAILSEPAVLVAGIVVLLILGIAYFASKSKSKSSGKAKDKKKDKTKDKEKGKSSRVPVEEETIASNGLKYKSNSKHTPGGQGNRRNAGIEPRNSLELFEKSVPSKQNPKVRFSYENGTLHRFFSNKNGTWHWSGSTNQGPNSITGKEVPLDIKKLFNLKLKGW